MESLAMARSALEHLNKPEQQVQTRKAAGGTETAGRAAAAASHMSPPSAQPSTSLPKLISAQKRKKLSPKTKEQKKYTSENFIIKKEDMVKLCEDVACKWCYESRLECKFIHHQVDIHVAITCGNCHRHVMNTAPEPVVSENARYFPFTLILVYIVMLLGVGYSGIETVCGMLSLKHFTFETYVRYAQYVMSKAVEHTKDILMDSRKAVFKFYAEELGRYPDENGAPPERHLLLPGRPLTRASFSQKYHLPVAGISSLHQHLFSIKFS
ncbi:hypothetical protein E2C01_053836 [Portunus trituberculatus]|uniref:Uncharacterized protein n=1 Tax=Portunus trituberculatus TaxID=210409 RepID=A0A5B7GRW3_PORTR|nr:hypothetical protein [Portunus trituberculatus]